MATDIWGRLPETQDVEEDEHRNRKSNQAQILIALAGDAALFHTPDGEPYADISVNGHSETWPLRSRGFRRWLLRRFYENQGKAPGAQAVQDALGVLEAQACFDGSESPVFIRLAELGGRIYLDLCDDGWQVVEVTPAGWRVLDKSPVKFRRAKGMLPIPWPEKGGSIEDLRPFVNCPGDAEWILLVSWLLAALKPTGPYPVLALQGEQGSAKSTSSRAARLLVDPNIALLRTPPRDERDLAIAANNSWVLAFDNLAGVPGWLSDSLCRVSTGGGFSTRTLYENDEETIFDFMRPAAVNGIEEVISRHDLLDRTLVVTLPAIPERERRDEHTFWAAFEEARPRILGALLDAVAAGLANWAAVKLDKLPRMADFARWIVACESALPWEPGAFMAAYRGNRADAVMLALEADPVAVAVTELLDDNDFFEGTASELLDALETCVPDKVRNARGWPKAARALSNRLRRAATFLRQTGLVIEYDREPGGKRRRLIRLRKESCVPSVPNVPTNDKPLLDDCIIWVPSGTQAGRSGTQAQEVSSRTETTDTLE